MTRETVVAIWKVVEDDDPVLATVGVSPLRLTSVFAPIIRDLCPDEKYALEVGFLEQLRDYLWTLRDDGPG